MSAKVTGRIKKVMVLRNVPMSDHWRLEIWATKVKLGKYELAEKIIHDAVKNVNLDKELETATA